MTISGGFGAKLLIDVSGLTVVAGVVDMEFPEFEKILSPSTGHDSAGGYATSLAVGKRRLNEITCILTKQTIKHQLPCQTT